MNSLIDNTSHKATNQLYMDGKFNHGLFINDQKQILTRSII